MYSIIRFINLEKNNVLDNRIISFNRNQSKKVAGQG